MTKQQPDCNSYPNQYIKKIKLKNGTNVILRPIKPEDEYIWLDMFKHFSEETIRYRFFRMIKDTPHEMRMRFCDIDYNKEMGIVAEINKNGKRQFIGVVRIIAEPKKKREAEFAIVVRDKWRRLGLGSEFMDFIIEIARDMKLKKLYGFALYDNTPMISLCKKKNFKVERGDPGEYKIELIL
jgi:acetyltransferase